MDLLAWPIYLFYMLLTSLLLLAFGVWAVAAKAKVPGRFQVTVEMMMEYLRDTFLGALGPGGERHLPLIFALFWYILFCNLLGLIPLFKAATSNPSTTIGLGIVVFFYTQYVGITSKGLWPYFKHFFGPLLILAPLFFVIEILGELIKPFSLGMRLFGNIYAEDIINDLAAGAGQKYFIPFQVVVYFLQIFTGSIQAFIFALLSCAYIGLMSETHHDEGDDADHHPHREDVSEEVAESLGSIGARVPS